MQGQEWVSIVDYPILEEIPTVRKNNEDIARNLEEPVIIRINPRENLIDPYYGLSLACGGLEGLTSLLE